MKTISIVHIFYDVHMGMQHKGLRELMSTKMDEPKDGEIVLFINAAWTATKLLAPGNTFLYHRSTHKELTLEIIKNLPSAFGGEPLRFSKELAAAMLKKFERARKQAA